MRAGTLGSLAQVTAEKAPRGEVTLVVGPASEQTSVATDDDSVRARLEKLVEEGQTRRDAVRQVTDETGLPKRHVYDLAT